MEATFVNAKNAVMFVPGLPDELIRRAGLITGAITSDETACRVAAFEEQTALHGSEAVLNLLYIYVQQDHRRMGAASRMLSLAMRYAETKGISAIQAQYPRTPEMLPVFRLLEYMGFEQDDNEDMVLWRVSLKYFEEPFMMKEVRTSLKIRFLEDIDSRTRKGLRVSVQEEIRKGSDRITRIALGTAYDEFLSCVVFAGEDMEGCCLIREGHGGDIILDSVMLRNGNVKVFFEMMRAVCIRIRKKHGEDAMLRFIPSDETENMLVSRFVRDNGEYTNLVYHFYAV